mgnify:CR=1 FL=1
MQSLALALCLVATAGSAGLSTAADAQAQSRHGRGVKSDEQDFRPAPNQTRPLPEIVASVQSVPPYNDMDYIGVAGFEVQSMSYVLRFLDGRQVVAVRVDARSGRILRRVP